MLLPSPSIPLQDSVSLNTSHSSLESERPWPISMANDKRKFKQELKKKKKSLSITKDQNSVATLIPQGRTF